MSKAEEITRHLVDLIVEEKDKVEIESKSDEMGVLISLKVAKSDMGRIIGKNGETAKAIRTILRVIGFSENARVSLRIIEPDEQ